MRLAFPGIKITKKTIALFLFLHAGFFLMIGLVFMISTWIFLADAVKTTGTIVSYKTQNSKHGNLLYSPVVKYRDSNGTEHTHSDDYYSSPKIGETGGQIGILYSRLAPAQSKIDNFMRLHFMPWIFLFFGILEVPIAALLMRSYKKDNFPVGHSHEEEYNLFSFRFFFGSKKPPNG